MSASAFLAIKPIYVTAPTLAPMASSTCQVGMPPNAPPVKGLQ